MRKKRRADGTFVEEDEEKEEGKTAQVPAARHAAVAAPSKPEKPTPPAKRRRTSKKAKHAEAAAAAAEDAKSATEPTIDVGVDPGDIDERALRAAMNTSKKTSPEVMAQVRKLHAEVGASIDETTITHINRNVSPVIMHNVVAKCELRHPYAVYPLAWDLKAYHNRKQFSAPVCLGLTDPRVTALIFRTGKVVVVGAKSERATKYAMYRLAAYISEKTGTRVVPHNITGNNIMATVYLGYRVDMDRVCKAFTQDLFNDRVFGAAKICVKDGVVLLFSSGTFVICGPRDTKGLTRIRDELIPKFAQFRTEDVDYYELERAKRDKEAAYRDASQRRRDAHDAAEIRAKIESDTRRIYHKYTVDAVRHIVGLERIDLKPCLPLIGAPAALNRALQAGIPFPYDPTPAIHATKDVCRHRLQVCYHGSRKPGVLHPIGHLGSTSIIQLYRQNGLELPKHFSEPPPPVQKRRVPRKKTKGEEGTFILVEGETLRVKDKLKNTTHAAPTRRVSAAAKTSGKNKPKRTAK